ncbi:hypothetical protein [Microcystis phage Mel-JY34]
MIYLASPFASTNTEERIDRILQAEHASHWLLGQGVRNFSPIAHNARAAESLYPHHTSVYLDLDFEILSMCEGLCVFLLPEWNRSRGVLLEIGYSISRNLRLSTIARRSETEFVHLPIAAPDLLNMIYSEEF